MQIYNTNYIGSDHSATYRLIDIIIVNFLFWPPLILFIVLRNQP